MPLNFPSSPTLNQTYSVGDRTYKYNGQGWDLFETSIAVNVGSNVVVSTTAPSSATANPGDYWIDSDDGKQYILINDGTSKQWVEVGTSTFNADNAYATFSYVDNAVANVVNSAPETLDTLNELAAALGDDNNFATTTVTLISQSYNQANTALSTANTKASTGKAIAMAIVFGGG